MKSTKVNKWVEILKEKPFLIDNCDVVNKFKSDDWFNILIKQPLLIGQLNDFTKMSSDNWFKLLEKYPEIIKEYPKSSRDQLITKLITISNFSRMSFVKEADEKRLRKLLYKSNKENYKILIEEYVDKKYHDSKVLTDMINLYPDLKKLYTEKDLWMYVNTSKLNFTLEYEMLK